MELYGRVVSILMETLGQTTRRTILFPLGDSRLRYKSRLSRDLVCSTKIDPGFQCKTTYEQLNRRL